MTTNEWKEEIVTNGNSYFTIKRDFEYAVLIPKDLKEQIEKAAYDRGYEHGWEFQLNQRVRDEKERQK